MRGNGGEPVPPERSSFIDDKGTSLGARHFDHFVGVERSIHDLALSNGIRSAVAGWFKTLVNDVAGEGATVNVLMTRRILTQRVHELDAADAKRMDTNVAEVAAKSPATIPAGRYGKSEEFADVVTFLASARADYITGSEIRIDGGSIKLI